MQTTDSTIMIYLPEPDVLDDLHPGWPPSVGLAFALGATGEAEASLFTRLREAPIDAIARRFGTEAGDALVTPALEGHGTRTLSFADEQALLAALAEIGGLPEAARVMEADALARGPARAAEPAARDLPTTARDAAVRFRRAPRRPVRR